MLRLGDETADQVEDVSHAVIEFGNQQFLLLARPFALARDFVAHPQDHFQQSHPQPFGYLQFVFGPVLAAIGYRFLPGGETLARLEPVAGRGDCLVRIAGPGHRLTERTPPQGQIVARRARQRDDYGACNRVREGKGSGDVVLDR